MEILCYSFTFKNITDYSEKSFKVEDMYGNTTFIPKSQFLMKDEHSSLANTYWIPAFVLKTTPLKFSYNRWGIYDREKGTLGNNFRLTQKAMKIEIINKSKHNMPEYSTVHSAGMDLRANIDSPITLAPMGRVLVPTGIYIALPVGFEAQIRPRSGLAIKKGISVLNSPGTIDSDYRGEVCVILVNLSTEAFVIEDGERIAQMVIAQHERAEWVPVEVLSETTRGNGGFGHTGTK